MSHPTTHTFSLRGLQISRREFLTYSAGTLGAGSLASLVTACGGSSHAPTYPISAAAFTTEQKMLSFPATLPGMVPADLKNVPDYATYGYGEWTYGAGLPVVTRTDLYADGYVAPAIKRRKRLAHFFSFSDIHITDKEAPNQLIQMLRASRMKNASR